MCRVVERISAFSVSIHSYISERLSHLPVFIQACSRREKDGDRKYSARRTFGWAERALSM